MPRILMIARFFPPIGGAGVHRTLGSVRYLPEHGYEPVLVTGTGQPRGRWDARDHDLVKRVPSRTEVHRVPGVEPEAQGRMGVGARRLGFGTDAWVRWWVDEAVRLGEEVGAGADLVLASCAPYETAFAGARLAARLDIPWVADLEDPWALDEMRLHATALHAAADRRRMRRALRSASAVVMAAPEAARRLRCSMPELESKPVTAIPIGFDPADFEADPRPRENGLFRIVHTGSMHTDSGLSLRRSRRRRRLLGGSVDGLDIVTRSHVFLLQAIERLLAAEPQLRDRMELCLAGALTQSDIAVAERHDFVRIHGLMPHSDTVALMRSADLLFLPMQDLPAGTRASLIPYKTYEYLATGRPILAAVPDGDVRDMLSPMDHVTLVRPADVDGMLAVLQERVGDRSGSDDRPARHEFQRRTCVAQIAEVLDSVLGRAVPAVTPRWEAAASPDR